MNSRTARMFGRVVAFSGLLMVGYFALPWLWPDALLIQGIDGYVRMSVTIVGGLSAMTAAFAGRHWGAREPSSFAALQVRPGAVIPAEEP